MIGRLSCQAYLRILKDFQDSDFNVEISWYQYSVGISEWNESITNEIISTLEKRVEEIEVYQGKYMEARGLLCNVKGRFNLGVVTAFEAVGSK